MGPLSINDYILKIKEIGDALLAAGQIVIDFDLSASMLGGLGHEFDPIVVLVSSQRNTMTMQEAQYLIIKNIEMMQGIITVTIIEMEETQEEDDVASMEVGGIKTRNLCVKFVEE
ncbi:hypothetical protein ACOSQ3_019668 [Xanthoceras sorbifolium]